MMANMGIKTKTTGAHSGVTLVEVMIGSVIIAMVFLSTMATLSIGFRSSESARLNADAQFHLESELEYIRSLSWSEIETLKTNYDNAKDSNKSLSFYTASTNNRLASAISLTNRESRSDQMEILLEVSWTDTKGKTHNANLVTIVTKSGVSAS